MSGIPDPSFSAITKSRTQLLDAVKVFLEDHDVGFVGPFTMAVQHPDESCTHHPNPLLSLTAEIRYVIIGFSLPSHQSASDVIHMFEYCSGRRISRRCKYHRSCRRTAPSWTTVLHLGESEILPWQAKRSQIIKVSIRYSFHILKALRLHLPIQTFTGLTHLGPPSHGEDPTLT